MKKIANFLAPISFFFIFTNYIHAAGLEKPLTTPVTIDDGNAPIAFSVQLSSTSWTLILSSDTISRTVYFELPTNTQPTLGICLSPSTYTITKNCGDSYAGPELSTGTATTWTTHDHAAWYGETRSTSSSSAFTEYIKGVRERDSNDYGFIQKENQ